MPTSATSYSADAWIDKSSCGGTVGGAERCAAMPRYFLNLFNDVTVADEAGTDWPDLSYATAQAVGAAREMMAEHLSSGQPIGDAAALTAVHVNRVLKGLRDDGLVTLRGRQVTIPNWENLCKAGDFDAAYLCADTEPNMQKRMLAFA